MVNDKHYKARCRIILARDLNIPPDNLDLDIFFGCIERSIRETFLKGENIIDELKIIPKGKNEIKAFMGEFTEPILDRIFNQKYPFEDYLETTINFFQN